MHKHPPRLLSSGRVSAAVAWALALAAGTAHGQTGSESSVGYIDSAIPANQLRLRFDASYGNPIANRGQFIYARSVQQPGEQVETNVDIQELSAYAEFLLSERFSVFFEAQVRFINPEVDPNAKGLGDVDLGFKWAFVHDDCQTLSFQLRGYAPTGNGDFHLGTSHPTLEPALLGYRRLTDRLAAEGELRVWVPLTQTERIPYAVSGGSANFNSTVVRYGVGLEYRAYENERLALVPVTELVGWTFLNGKKTIQEPLPSGSDVSAAGDTIVNLKLGARLKMPALGGDLYVGYGRPLTGETFYKDILRAEWRFTY
jgi:hypothetical protein